MHVDLASYTRRVRPVEFADLDLAATFARRPLDPSTLRCLRYMHDVELHTVCYLRDLLLTPAHRDPRITTFLSHWVYEEHWHGEALAAVLRAHGEPAGDDRVQILREHLGWKVRFGPLTHILASAVVGESWVAIHMAWGAVNEWTTQAGYARLAAVAQHPALTHLLRRIMRQEGGHIDFYASEAQRRLAVDRRAQRLARFALRKLWQPVGANVMPPAELAFMVRHLFSGPDGRAAADRIDRQIDRLPGLAGLGLAQRAATRWAA